MVDEYYECDDCGWWAPRPYRVYDTKSIYTCRPDQYVLCKWCDKGINWKHYNREYFRFCCGQNSFAHPNAWFFCTYCGDVPAKYILNFVARRKSLTCCANGAITPSGAKLLQSYMCTALSDVHDCRYRGHKCRDRHRRRRIIVECAEVHPAV